MSRDVIMVGSTMRILLLYRGEYSYWHERFMNYLEVQTDGEAMINSIQNGDHPFPVKCGYKKDNCELNYKFLNNLQPEWKQYGTLMRPTKNLMDINIDALYNILKQSQGDVNDVVRYKKKAVVVTSDPLLRKQKYGVLSFIPLWSLVNIWKRIRNGTEFKNKTLAKFFDEVGISQQFSTARTPQQNGVVERRNRNLSRSCKNYATFANLTFTIVLWAEATTSTTCFTQNRSIIPLTFDKTPDDLGRSVSLLEKEKENLEIIESLKSKGFESSENAISESENQSKNDCQEVEKGYDNLENSKVIAPGMFKINVSQSVSPISAYKTSCASNNVENKTKRKRRKRTSSKQNDKQVNNDVLRANRDFVHFSDLDTLSSVRRPKHSGVIWKKKGSSNTSNVDLSSDSHSKLNKDVKRYSRKDLLSCNNSHHVDTRSAYACNDAMNVSCNSRLYASYDVNDLFVFDDVSIRKSQVSKMPFRKKSRDSLNVHSRSNSNKSLRRTAFIWLPKMQPLAEPVAKWIPKVKRCSKHMTGNRALLTNFVEKFLGTVRFGNNDFTTTCFVRNEDGVDLVTGDRSSNLYTIALNEITSNFSACLLAKASSSQSWLWHQHLSRLNFATINNLVKNNLVRGLPKMKFEKDHLCSTCEQGKIHQKHHKSKTDFASNKPLYLLHMDLYGPMRVKSINGKRYVLVVVDDYSWYTWVFFLHSKDEASEVIISFIKKTQENLQLQVQRVRTDNGTKFMNKTLAKFFDEVGISQQFSTARTPQQNGVVERRNRTLVEATRTMHTFANLPLFLWAKAIAAACFTQNRLIIQKCFDKTPYELINRRKPNIKFFHVFGCRCYLLNDYDDVGKLKAKGDIGVFVGYSKESAAFRVYNKRTRKIHESVNVNFDEISEMASKQFSLEPGLSNLNETGKSSNPTVSQVSEISKKDLEDLFHNFYDEYFDSSKITKSPTTNVETSNNEISSHEGEVFHEVSESFQEESSSSSLNDDVQQSSKEVMVSPTNTQSISNNMVPNVNEASSSHNVFNERLEDAYFDASTTFHDPSNVHTFYQPYPHEKNIKPANMAEALKDVDWNKKDESSLVIRNKASLVAVGYCQRDGIDYDETFALVSRIEAICLFLAYAAHKDLTVF
ncbi:retrovirus-related pol polyprotein from transposon TNT 1-94 [Tanacetum coccineum]|uniref:Retrovirus-related pol polyprotein from transposon TNT 1-94 n=1 Tax=Tanacetum coccineum TaxID=301880 RepID=A0ABQ5GWD8_9ASTR